MSKPLSLCPGCLDHCPMFTLNEFNQVMIMCECGYQQMELPLEEYLSKIKSNTERFSTIRTTCTEHNSEYKFFCRDCNKYFCQQCKEGHQCELLDLEKQKKELNYEKVKENYKKAEEYLNSYFPSLKEKYKSVPKIDEAYEKCIKDNKKIFEFKQLIIENAVLNNSIFLELLKFSAHFTIYPFIEKNAKSDSIIDYFNGYNFDIFKPTNQIELPFSSVNSIITLKDKRIAISGDSEDILILDPVNNYHIDITVKGHEAYVHALCQTENGNLISGDSFSNIKIWSLTKDSFTCLHTIESKSEEKQELEFFLLLPENRFAYFFNKKIHIHSTEAPFALLKELSVENAYLSNMIYIKEKDILLATSNHKVLKYDMKTYKCVESVELEMIGVGHRALMQLDTERLLIGGMTHLWVFNVSTMKVEKNIDNVGFARYTSFVELRDTKYILAGLDLGLMLLIDRETLDYIVFRTVGDMINCHINDVICYDNGTIIDGSSDDVLRVWKY